MLCHLLICATVHHYFAAKIKPLRQSFCHHNPLGKTYSPEIIPDGILIEVLVDKPLEQLEAAFKSRRFQILFTHRFRHVYHNECMPHHPESNVRRQVLQPPGKGDSVKVDLHVIWSI